MFPRISHLDPRLPHTHGRALILALGFVLLTAPVMAAQSSSAASILSRAQTLAAAHQYEQANEALSALVQSEPQNALAWQQLGQVQLQQQLYGDAMRSFQDALAINPHAKASQQGEIHAAVQDALAIRAAGDQDDALAKLLEAIKVVPDSPELLTDFGIQADSMNIYQDADKALTKAHRLDPSNLKTLYALAHVELDEQNMPAAEKHLREYLQKRPDDATARYGLGHLLHMLSKDDEAITQLKRSIALQPQQIASYYELGVIALDRGNNTEAQSEFTHVLKLNPYHGGALTGMGQLAFRAANYQLAEKYLSQAVLYAPSYVPAHRYYAMTLMRLGKKSQASQQLAEAQSLTAQQQKLSHGYMLKNQTAQLP
jgi:tetratricopeptide (TPR) repeat protein